MLSPKLEKHFPKPIKSKWSRTPFTSSLRLKHSTYCDMYIFFNLVPVLVWRENWVHVWAIYLELLIIVLNNFANPDDQWSWLGLSVSVEIKRRNWPDVTWALTHASSCLSLGVIETLVKDYKQHHPFHRYDILIIIINWKLFCFGWTWKTLC